MLDTPNLVLCVVLYCPTLPPSPLLLHANIPWLLGLLGWISYLSVVIVGLNDNSRLREGRGLFWMMSPEGKPSLIVEKAEQQCNDPHETVIDNHHTDWADYVVSIFLLMTRPRAGLCLWKVSWGSTSRTQSFWRQKSHRPKCTWKLDEDQSNRETCLPIRV